MLSLDKYINKLDTSLTSEEYHTLSGSYSSSQLKTMLEDAELFHKKYVTKELPRDENPAFAVGTYFHTEILEPEKLEEECIVYPGATRRGAEWEAFKEKHSKKAIITKGDKLVVEKLVAAVKNSPVSMEYLRTSKAEVSAFIRVFVMGGEIFSFKNDECYFLSVSEGWVKGSKDFDEEDIKDYGVALILKVRADSLGQGTGVISDLKSTSGNTLKHHEMQAKVSSLSYDLSASLYLDLFSFVTGEKYHTFVWIFASKDMGNCKAWKASDSSIKVGRAKWKKAVVEIAKYTTNKWSFSDSLGTLDAPPYAVSEWL